MDGVAVMMEPLDGYLRTQAYVYAGGDSDNEFRGDVSVRTYNNRLKISPADMDCSYEAFEKFVEEWTENVCELEFVGGLECMDVN